MLLLETWNWDYGIFTRGLLFSLLSGLANCVAEIKSCKFENNTAENYGGSMYITSGVMAQVISVEFENIDKVDGSRPTIGDIIESR